MFNDDENKRKEIGKDKSDDSETGFQDYLTKKSGEFNHNSFRLSEVGLIDQTTCSDVEIGLLKFYDSGVLRQMLLAAMLHSAIRHGRLVFLKSNENLLEILKADPNAKKKRSSWSSAERDKAVGYLLDAFFEEVVPPMSHPSIPAIWRVKDPRVRKIIAARHGIDVDELEKEQMERIMDWRDGVEESIAVRNKRKLALQTEINSVKEFPKASIVSQRNPNVVKPTRFARTRKPQLGFNKYSDDE
jgi:hypothetical protein